MSENNTPTPENPGSSPQGAPVQTQDQTPPAPVPAPPPAANLVVSGEVTDERVLQLQKKLSEAEEARRKAEFLAAEKERENEELKKIPVQVAPKVKREKSMFRPLIGADDDEE